MINPQKWEFLNGISQQGRGPSIAFCRRAAAFPYAEQEDFEAESSVTSVTVEKKRIFLLNQHKDLLLGKENGFLSCSEAKVLLRLTYLYVCNLE